MKFTENKYYVNLIIFLQYTLLAVAREFSHVILKNIVYVTKLLLCRMRDYEMVQNIATQKETILTKDNMFNYNIQVW